jgi:hypothetical protein
VTGGGFAGFLESNTTARGYPKGVRKSNTCSCGKSGTDYIGYDLAAIASPGRAVIAKIVVLRVIGNWWTGAKPRYLDLPLCQGNLPPMIRIVGRVWTIPPPILSRTTSPCGVVPTIQTGRVPETKRVSPHIPVRIQPATQPNRITLDIASQLRQIIPEIVVSTLHQIGLESWKHFVYADTNRQSLRPRYEAHRSNLRQPSYEWPLR